jgi:hypothetical protein
MNTMTTENAEQMEAREARNQLLADFKSKKSDYPSQWNDCYTACKADEDFVLGGNQFTPQMAKSYGFGKNFRMPNMLKPYINNQANQTLQNFYKAVVSPNGGGADIGKARMREQVLRGIQRVGGASEVYNYARRGQLAGGLHYSKVVVDYANPRGMEQEYVFEDVQDTFSVFPDPYVQKTTFADMGDFLIREDVPKAKWQEKTGSKWTFGNEKTHPIWFYWRKIKTLSDKEYIGVDGQPILESELPIGADQSPDFTMVQRGEDGTPYSREVSKHQWEWYVIDDKADNVYAEGQWLGECSPLVACSGEKVIQRNGQGVKVFYRSLAHDAKEPQMVYTICENIILLQLAKSPYPHYEIARGTINVKQLQEYRESNVIGAKDILWEAWDGDKSLPKPNRVMPDGVDPDLIELQQLQLQKIERILGIYDAALGQKSNEKSGVAIKERAKQSNLANYHFEFNFIEYVRQMGYVVLESMPNYLSVRQVVPMLDNDDKIVMREINGPSGISFVPGERYRMAVEVVPDSDTNREAEADMLMRMADSPVLGPVIMQTPGAASKVVKAQKGRYAQEIGAMMEGAGKDPEKQAMREQMRDMQEQGKAVTAELEALKASKDLEATKEANRHAEAMAKIQLDAAKTADKIEIDAFRAETDREKVNGMPQTPATLNNEVVV